MSEKYTASCIQPLQSPHLSGGCPLLIPWPIRDFSTFRISWQSSFMAGKFFKTHTVISCPPRNTSWKSIEQRLLQVPKTVQQGWTAVRAPFKRSAFAKDRRNQTSLLPFCWYLLRLWFDFSGSVSEQTWMPCSNKKNFLLWWFYRKSESTKKSLHMDTE